MAKDIIGTGYYEIQADLTKIRAQLAAFQNTMKGKNLEMGLAGANNQGKKLNSNLTGE